MAHETPKKVLAKPWVWARRVLELILDLLLLDLDLDLDLGIQKQLKTIESAFVADKHKSRLEKHKTLNVQSNN